MTEERKTNGMEKNEVSEEQLEEVSGGAGISEDKTPLYHVGQQVIVTIRDEIGPDCIPVNRQEKAEIVSVSYGYYQRSFFEPGVSGVYGQGFIYNVRYLDKCSYATTGIPECFVRPV